MSPRGGVSLRIAGLVWAVARVKPFYARAMAAELKCDRRSARRVCAWLEELGVVVRQGDGEQTRWRPVGAEEAVEQLINRRGAA